MEIPLGFILSFFSNMNSYRANYHAHRVTDTRYCRPEKKPGKSKTNHYNLLSLLPNQPSFTSSIFSMFFIPPKTTVNWVKGKEAHFVRGWLTARQNFSLTTAATPSYKCSVLCFFFLQGFCSEILPKGVGLQFEAYVSKCDFEPNV